MGDAHTRPSRWCRFGRRPATRPHPKLAERITLSTLNLLASFSIPSCVCVCVVFFYELISSRISSSTPFNVISHTKETLCDSLSVYTQDLVSSCVSRDSIPFSFGSPGGNTSLPDGSAEISMTMAAVCLAISSYIGKVFGFHRAR